MNQKVFLREHKGHSKKATLGFDPQMQDLKDYWDSTGGTTDSTGCINSNGQSIHVQLLDLLSKKTGIFLEHCLESKHKPLLQPHPNKETGLINIQCPCFIKTGGYSGKLLLLCYTELLFKSYSWSLSFIEHSLIVLTSKKRKKNTLTFFVQRYQCYTFVL